MKVIRRVDITAANGILTSSNVTDSTETSWTAAGVFNTGDLCQKDGSSEGTQDYNIYQSQVDANSGNDPYLRTDDTNWKFVGAMNKWKAYNDIAQDQTSNALTIVNEMTFTSVVDSIAVINTNAASYRVEQIVSGSTVFDTGTVSLISTAGIVDLYTYFFEPIVRKTSFAVTGLQPYATATVRITLTVDSGNCLAGAIVPGQILEIGKTMYGASYSILDYSQKTVDADTGLVTVTTRSNKRTAECDVSLAPSSLGSIYDALKDLLNDPAVWITTDSIDGTIVFGPFKDFNLIVDNYSEVICRLEIGDYR